jgi:hypothetical protein
MRKVNLYFAALATLIVLIVLLGLAVWFYISTWRSPGLIVVNTSDANNAHPLPSPPAVSVISPEADFQGVWTGKWDQTYPARLTISHGNGRVMRVIYQWQDPPGAAWSQKILRPTPLGKVLRMPRAGIVMTMSSTSPDTADATWHFTSGSTSVTRHATLVRNAGPTVTNWLVNSSPGDQSIILDIKATIDGGDLLKITPKGANWIHNQYALPTDISVNGVSWDPGLQPNLHKTGLEDVDFSTARVVWRSGRDVVAMENTPDGITVYFNDTPPSAAPYEIKIAMQRASAATRPATRPSGHPVVIDLRAVIDGSDCATFTPQGAQWTHLNESWPGKVTLGGAAWDVQASPELDLPGFANIDFSSARVLSRSGRDTVMMEHEDNGIAVYFADGPNGAAPYEIKILCYPK